MAQPLVHPQITAVNLSFDPLEPTLETTPEDEDLDLADDSIDAAIAHRVILLSHSDAALAEQAYKEHGIHWYEKSGLFDDRGGLLPVISRERAFSAPIPEKNIFEPRKTVRGNYQPPSVEEAPEIWAVSRDHEPLVSEAHPEVVHVAQSLGRVVGAMLAEGDRGQI